MPWNLTWSESTKIINMNNKNLAFSGPVGGLGSKTSLSPVAQMKEIAAELNKNLFASHEIIAMHVHVCTRVHSFLAQIHIKLRVYGLKRINAWKFLILNQNGRWNTSSNAQKSVWRTPPYAYDMRGV